MSVLVFFVIGFVSGVVFFVGGGLLLMRWAKKRTLKEQGRKLSDLTEDTEYELLEAMRIVAKKFFLVPDTAIENGLAVSFGDDDNKPKLIVSISREGKKSFAELFLEAGKDREKLRGELTLLESRYEYLTGSIACGALKWVKKKEPKP